jgi:2-aminoethylphosphonate aminotransferase
MPIQRNILLTPGPATTTDTVKMAQVVPDICPREQAFCALVNGLRSDLVRCAGGTNRDHTCVLFSGSGTAGMEAMIAASVPAGQRIAVVVNGAYGQRLADIATTYQLNPLIIPFPVTTPADAERIAVVLDQHQEVGAVAVVHHETTTGLLNPIREIGTEVRKRGRLFLVDAVSSFGGMPVDLMADHVDVLVSVANKCLQGMAGVAFALASRDALEQLRGHPRRNYYLHLVDQYDSLETNGQFRFTAPVSALYALRRALDELQAEGLAARSQRYAENTRLLRDGLRSLGFQLLLEDRVASNIMTSVMEPAEASWSFAALHDALLQRGITIYPGKLSDLPTFRMATIGDLYPADIQTVLAAVRDIVPALRR